MKVYKYNGEGDNVRTKFYARIPKFESLVAIYNWIEHDISDIKTVSKFQQFMITIIKIKCNFIFMDIAYRLNISNNAALRIFIKF